MLFDVANDAHETNDLIADVPDVAKTGASILDEWTAEQLDRSLVPADPMDTVREEGGPFHTRHHLPAYLERLRATGRGQWADVLVERHPTEAIP
jgi:hypothetical protein